jgi:hypothetical protein
MDEIKISNKELKSISKEELLELINDYNSISHKYKLLIEYILDAWKDSNKNWSLISWFTYIGGALCGLLIAGVFK